jgi:hypothetical protein
MSHDKHRPPDISKLSDNDVVGELIRRAGPRARAADYLSDGFKETAVEHWQRAVARHRRRLWLRRAAAVTLAAAAALGFATIALRLVAPLTEARPLALVERVVGELRSEDGARTDRLAAGAAVAAGEGLGTGRTGGAALRLGNGIAFRLDRETRAVLVSQNRLRLERGAVYVDATGAADAEFLDVETALGIARDIGTIYQVREDGPAVLVQVRRGRVAVRNEDGRHEVDAGRQLALSPDGGVEHSAVSLHGPVWEWVHGAAPAFALEGATLADYLDWLGRETGWYIRFAAAQRETLLQTRLHGSLEGVAPQQTPELVLPGCGLSHRLEDGTLIVEPEEPAIRTRT